MAQKWPILCPHFPITYCMFFGNKEYFCNKFCLSLGSTKYRIIHTFNVDTATQLHAFIPYHSLLIDDAQDFRDERNWKWEASETKGFLSPKFKIAKAKTDHNKTAAQYTCCIERDDSSSMHARKNCMWCKTARQQDDKFIQIGVLESLQCYVGTYTSARMCTSTRPCSVLFKNEFTSIV